MNTEQKIDRSDARAFARYKYETELAQLDGKPLEYTRIGKTDWSPRGVQDAPLRWDRRDYRIVPEPAAPTHVPYTFETGPLVERVRRKKDGQVFIVHLQRDGKYYSVDFGHKTAEQLFTDFEQLSGEPCGTPVADWRDSWPKYAKDGTELYRLSKDRETRFWCKQNNEWLVSAFNSNDFEGFHQIPASEALKLTGGVE